MNIRKALIYDSMNQRYILLLALFWSAFNPWQLSVSESHEPLTDYWFLTDGEDEEIVYEDLDRSSMHNVPELSITVYHLMEDREHVIVLCKSAEMFRMTYRWQSFELSVESELNYTIEALEFSDSSEMHGYMVTVSPPASFTCVREIGFHPNLDGDVAVRNLRSQTYNYSGSVLDHHNHHEEGVSLLYICFSSFIAVGLFIMTAAVIVTNIRSKTKDTNSTAVTDNDYVET